MPGNRNSCFKIDPDATFMHMKYDYYKHTNVFKPEYNIQFGISDGIVSVPSRTALRRIGYALTLDLTFIISTLSNSNCSHIFSMLQ